MRVNPIDALNGFEAALGQKSIKLSKCDLDKDLSVHLDHPDGRTPRFTYAFVSESGGWLSKKIRVTAVAVMVADDPYKGLPCFHISYAVSPDQRGQGLAQRIVKSAIRELQNGLSRNGVKRFYLEAVVDQDNPASLAIADKIFTDEREEKISDDGEAVVHYFKLVQ